MQNNMTVSSHTFSCHYTDLFAFAKTTAFISHYLNQLGNCGEREIVYLCIGTDRVTGDCLGPLVGTKLRQLLPGAKLFGTLKDPVHARNLEEKLAEIQTSAEKPLIVAVDASLGQASRVGYININLGGLSPGSALRKVLPVVGDFHISGIVNTAGYFEHLVLQNTRLFIVDAMAEVIARGLFMAEHNYRHQV